MNNDNNNSEPNTFIERFGAWIVCIIFIALVAFSLYPSSPEARQGLTSIASFVICAAIFIAFIVAAFSRTFSGKKLPGTDNQYAPGFIMPGDVYDSTVDASNENDSTML